MLVSGEAEAHAKQNNTTRAGLHNNTGVITWANTIGERRICTLLTYDTQVIGIMYDFLVEIIAGFI